jgi:hypothetical protein
VPRLRWVAGVGLTAVAVILALVLLHGDQRRSGSDLTPNGAFVAALRAGQHACQDGELLPADTAAVRLTIGTYGLPGPPVQITFTGPHGESLTQGGLAAGWRQGVVDIPVRHVSNASAGVRVCLRNSGPQSIALAGDLPDPGYRMEVGGSSVEGRLRYDYMRPGRESWLALLPTIVYRSTLGKADLVRHWAWAAALVLMLFAVALAVRTILRDELG